MHIQKFKIIDMNKNELNLAMLTGSEIEDMSEIAYSHDARCYRRRNENYLTVLNLLQQLINDNTLEYMGQVGTVHKFGYCILQGSQLKLVDMEVSCKPAANREDKTLEAMLYAVCCAKNIAAPTIVKPKNLLTTMYNQLMYPNTPEAELIMGSAKFIVMLAALGAGFQYGRSSFNKLSIS